jgi:hypothetical protein
VCCGGIGQGVRKLYVVYSKFYHEFDPQNRTDLGIQLVEVRVVLPWPCHMSSCCGSACGAACGLMGGPLEVNMNVCMLNLAAAQMNHRFHQHSIRALSLSTPPFDS